MFILINENVIKKFGENKHNFEKPTRFLNGTLVLYFSFYKSCALYTLHSYAIFTF